MKNILLLGILTVFAWSCNDDDEIIPQLVSATPIQFSTPAVGQESIYLGFDASGYGTSEGYDDFDYNGDTLRLEIVDQIENDFVVEQRKSSNDEVYTFYFHLEGDHLIITDPDPTAFGLQSFLHWIGLNDWGSNDSMRLNLNPFSEQTDISGWQVTAPYCECFACLHTDEAEILSERYLDLNVIVDNIPMQVDGNGKTYVYSENEGFVRTMTYSWWTRTGSGWDLLKE